VRSSSRVTNSRVALKASAESEGLTRHAQPPPLLSQLLGLQVRLKLAEPDNPSVMRSPALEELLRAESSTKTDSKPSG